MVIECGSLLTAARLVSASRSGGLITVCASYRTICLPERRTVRVVLDGAIGLTLFSCWVRPVCGYSLQKLSSMGRLRNFGVCHLSIDPLGPALPGTWDCVGAADFCSGRASAGHMVQWPGIAVYAVARWRCRLAWLFVVWLILTGCLAQPCRVTYTVLLRVSVHGKNRLRITSVIGSIVWLASCSARGLRRNQNNPLWSAARADTAPCAAASYPIAAQAPRPTTPPFDLPYHLSFAHCAPTRSQ